MDLDRAFLSAAQIAELAQTDITSVHTWTTRGFADPYHAKPRVRRGRGKPRSYSRRDALRFFLMAQLHKQYGTPLPRGLLICQAVFGEENFDEDKAAYLVVDESAAAGSSDLGWHADLDSVCHHLATAPVTTVINVKHILGQISAKSRRFSPVEAT